MEKIYQCPLCKSVLVRENWIKIVGRWEEQQKISSEAQKKLKQAQKEKEDLSKKHAIEMKKSQKTTLEQGMKLGIAKESKRAETMAKMIISKEETIQELKKQLKEGKTPQIAGFDYEKDVIRLLCEAFPEDEIKPTGKKGDCIQFIKIGEDKIGSILFECKKTSKYENGFIKEVQKHQEVAMANFGVIVTHASKIGKSKFFIDNEIIVIDPLGLLDIAYLLRNNIIEMHKLKLTRAQMKEKGTEILKYMQKGEFKTQMSDTIFKAEEAYKIMVDEINSHKRNWESRYGIYCSIHDNVQNVRLEIGKIITGNQNLQIEGKIPELPK